MSSEGDAAELPPKEAPLAQRLQAAIERAGNPSNRKLGRALETDGSVIGKWLSGYTKQIKSRSHQKRLAEELGTPLDYFADDRSWRSQLEDQIGDLIVALAAAKRANDRLRSRVLTVEKTTEDLQAQVAELRDPAQQEVRAKRPARHEP